MKYNTNIRIHSSSYSTLAQLIQRQGTRIAPDTITRCGYSDTVYKIDVPIIRCTPNAVTVGGTTLRAEINRLTPPEQMTMPGQVHHALPRSSQDFAALAEAEGDDFAALLQEITAELQANPATGHLPTRTILHTQHMYAYKRASKRGAASHWFLAFDFEVELTHRSVQRVERMGVDVGLSEPFTIAPTDNIADVRTFKLPGGMGEWLCTASLDNAAQWTLMRQAFYHAVMPAFRFCAEAETVCLEELSFGRHMDYDYVQRARKIGLIDLVMVSLPDYLRLSGVDVQTYPPIGTSTTCHQCMQTGKRDKRIFVCCQHGTFDADANAAMVLRNGGVVQTWDVA